ncbi:MAG TPA: helix-turn-helix domain-containing protein [Solirubrobacteraceae bacterium]|nr:helix-turn-helix domain-containing protein [Solirubrobacteraceae bacterium]
MSFKSRRAEQTEATRRALVDAARALFAERGYADVATEEIVRQARVTRGALYHHFRGKEDLFRAVFEEINGELAERAAQGAMAAQDPWEQMRTGAHAFLDACLDPAVQQIALLDAPAVLGWETSRELDQQAGLGIAEAVIGAAMAAGAIQRGPLQPLAHLLLAALHEGAMLIARAQDVDAARDEVGRSVDLLLTGLRTRGGERPDA